MLMDSKYPEEGILMCGKQRPDGEHRSQTPERTLHPGTNPAPTATERV